MTEGTAQFYFANLGADILRCSLAIEEGKSGRYQSSLRRARRTLLKLRDCRRPEAYEEGLLLLRAMEYAKTPEQISKFHTQIHRLIGTLSSH